MEILIKHPGVPLPPLEEGELRYVVARNGTFIERRSGLFTTTCRSEQSIANLETHKENCALNCPKIPRRMVDEMLAFFRWALEFHGGEAALLLLFDPRAGTSSATDDSDPFRWHCPLQSVEHWESWSGKWFVSSNIEYTEPLELPPELVLFGDAHSHGELSAYASHTDKNDELYKDGLHIVAGHIDREDAKFHVDFVMDGRRFQIEPEVIFSTISADRAQKAPSVGGDTEAEPESESESESESRSTFPGEWKDQVSVERTPYTWKWGGYQRKGEP